MGKHCAQLGGHGYGLLRRGCGLRVGADHPRGRLKSLDKQQRRWLKRRQVIEPAIGHVKSDHRMDRCWLQGATGDALHAMLCAAGFNVRWLLRAIAAKGLKGVLLVLSHRVLWQRWGASALHIAHVARAARTRLSDLPAHHTLVAGSWISQGRLTYCHVRPMSVDSNTCPQRTVKKVLPAASVKSG
jgi:hypothetical protein